MIRKPRFANTRTASFWPRPGNLGMTQSVTVSCCTASTPNSASFTCCLAARYSEIASRMFAKASSRVAPCEHQPGRLSHQTAQPSSDFTKLTSYFVS